MIHSTCIYPTFCNIYDIRVFLGGEEEEEEIFFFFFWKHCYCPKLLKNMPRNFCFSISSCESGPLPYKPNFSLKLVFTSHGKIEVCSTTADTSLTIALLLGAAIIQYIFLCERTESCNNKA